MYHFRHRKYFCLDLDCYFLLYHQRFHVSVPEELKLLLHLEVVYQPCSLYSFLLCQGIDVISPRSMPLPFCQKFLSGRRVKIGSFPPNRAIKSKNNHGKRTSAYFHLRTFNINFRFISTLTEKFLCILLPVLAIYLYNFQSHLSLLVT